MTDETQTIKEQLEEQINFYNHRLYETKQDIKRVRADKKKFETMLKSMNNLQYFNDRFIELVEEDRNNGYETHTALETKEYIEKLIKECDDLIDSYNEDIVQDKYDLKKVQKAYKDL